MEFLRVLGGEVAQVDESVGEELVVVVGDDAVLVHVQEAVQRPHLAPPEVALSLQCQEVEMNAQPISAWTYTPRSHVGESSHRPTLTFLGPSSSESESESDSARASLLGVPLLYWRTAIATSGTGRSCSCMCRAKGSSSCNVKKIKCEHV